MQPTTADPIPHPKVKLGDTEYPIKFRLYDLVQLEKEHGIDLFTRVEVAGLAAMDRLAKILAAGVSHAVKMSLEDVMKNMELNDIPIYALAIAEAQKKVSPEAQQALEALKGMAAEAPKPASSKPN